MVRSSLAGFIQFPLVTFVAMIFYKGESVFNSNYNQYSFFYNFFSDLGRTHNNLGEQNLVSFFLFTISLSLLGVSIIIFHLITPYLINQVIIEYNLNQISTISGILAGVTLICVALTPVDIFPTPHLIFAALAFLFLFITAVSLSIMFLSVKFYSIKNTILLITYTTILGFYILIYWIISILYSHIPIQLGLFIKVTGQKITIYLALVCYLVLAKINLRILKDSNS